MAKFLVTAPFISYLFYRYYVYRDGLDEKKLRARILYLGHCIDLDFSDSKPIAKAKINELNFLVDYFYRKKIALDDSILWAIGLIASYKHKIPLAKASPESVPEPSVGREQFEVIIKSRRSVRKWSDELVGLDEINKAIELASWAPTSCNRQPWLIVNLSESDDKEFALDYFPNSFYKNAPNLLMVLMDAGVYGENEKHFVDLDAGAFIENMLLSFHAMGLGACWVGFKGWDASGNIFVDTAIYEKFYSYLRISKDVVPVSLIAVGRPGHIPKAPARQAIENIVIPRISKKR